MIGLKRFIKVALNRKIRDDQNNRCAIEAQRNVIAIARGRKRKGVPKPERLESNDFRRSTASASGFERGDSRFERRVAAEERHDAAAGNAAGGHLFRQFARFEIAERTKRFDHRATVAHQRSSSRVRAELAFAREVHHNDGGENAKENLEHNAANHVANADPALIVVPAQKAVDGVACDAGKKDHEGVEHALNQRQRDHVAILDVGNLVSQHRLDLLLVHALQEAGRNRDQRPRLARARRG